MPGAHVKSKDFRGFESHPLRHQNSLFNKNKHLYMENKKLTLSILPEKLGICHLSKNIPIPEWAEDISFCNIKE
jgi:hypothetical protein